MKNEALNILAIARGAVNLGVQNQLLYLLRVTKILATEFGDDVNLEMAIDYLSGNVNREEGWLGGGDFLESLDQKRIYEKICRKAKTPLMKECHVFGNYKENTFRRQYALYRNGLAII